MIYNSELLHPHVGNAIGLVGCIPCDDGYYASPSTTTPIQACKKCKMGSYSTQTNHSSCKHHLENGVIDISLCLSGAVSCEQCPHHIPNTYANGSTSIHDCKKCANEYYETPTGCRLCTPKCIAFQFEATQCTQYQDRKCEACYQNDCGTV